MILKSLRLLESCLSAAIGLQISVVIFVMAIGFAAQHFSEATPLQRVLWIVGAASVCTLETIYFFPILRRLRSSRSFPAVPFQLALAITHPTYPVILRPIVSIYWLSHFLFCFLALWMTYLLSNGLTLSQSITSHVLCVCFTYLCFAYLLLSISAWSRSHPWLRSLWLKRVRIALALNLLTFWAPFVLTGDR